MSIILDGTTGITTPDLIDSSLTSGRVVYAGASGNLTGSTGLVFDGTYFGIGANVTPNKSLTIYNASIDTEIRFQSSTKNFYLSQRNATGQVDYIVVDNAAQTWSVNNTEGMRLTSTGLGIGTSSPAAVLDVNGTIYAREGATAYAAFSALNGASGGRQYTLVSNATGSPIGAAGTFTIRDSTAGVNRLSIDSTGNLAIDQNFDGGYGKNISLNADDSGQTTRLQWKYTGTASAWIERLNANGAMAFGTQSAERMRIDASGNLVVGGTSTTFRFTAIGASASSIVSVASLQNPVNATGTGHGASLVLHSTPDSNRGVAIASSSTANYAVDNAMLFYTSASSTLSEKARIDSAGNLLVGTTSSSGVAANNRAIVGGGFHSLNGELSSLAHATAYTMFTAPADFATYLVNVHGGASAAIYSETAIVQINNTSVRVDIISDGATVVIDNSGYAIRATQNSGNTMGYLIWSAVRMA